MNYNDSVSLVFPIYNEEKRIHKLLVYLDNFKIKNNLKFECIFVNDGSTDSTLKILKKFLVKTKKKNIKFNLISYKKNRGKGHAVKKGVLSSTKNWILILDCDLSTDIDQLFIWIKKKYIVDDNSAYFGSRLLKNSNLKTSYTRKFYGYIFTWIINFLFKIDIKDTQCGFKLIHKNYAKKIFNKIKTNGYAYDIDLYFLLIKNKIGVVELPVSWRNKSGSKINLLIDPFYMLFEIFRIKAKK